MGYRTLSTDPVVLNLLMRGRDRRRIAGRAVLCAPQPRKSTVVDGAQRTARPADDL